jgi:hypothetical protein
MAWQTGAASEATSPNDDVIGPGVSGPDEMLVFRQNLA